MSEKSFFPYLSPLSSHTQFLPLEVREGQTLSQVALAGARANHRLDGKMLSGYGPRLHMAPSSRGQEGNRQEQMNC